MKVQFIFLMTTLMALCILSMAAASSAFAMGLKPGGVLESDVLTLGDVFYDLPRDAGKVLGPAPRPGSEMVLDSKTLTRVAMALNLPWRPAGAHEKISFTRAATMIDADTVETVIKRELSAKGLPGKFDLIVTSGSADIILPQSQPASFDITDLTFDLQKGLFKAAIAAPTAANALVKQEVSGAIEQIVPVPVLRESLSNGAIIGERDIEVIEVPGRQIASKTILAPSDIIGMTPRRTVLAGSPLSREELAAPQLVQRGKSVLMTYKSGSLVLTSQGKALENAAKGERVRVVNSSTNRTLEGVAVAEGEVEITTF
ncbi:MAG TPA: flagellar basal body P-ring formation chaperone FlgA [Alphaproteobacteria bacterium]|nr:flagellar basal body P-ring formation chaperone FlgA [Alphaproteobacteria bacterium]